MNGLFPSEPKEQWCGAIPSRPQVPALSGGDRLQDGGRGSSRVRGGGMAPGRGRWPRTPSSAMPPRRRHRFLRREKCNGYSACITSLELP